ncbi:hypothetical protein GLAREA_09818 [Glarea lozoyensis ATCC 20868]|uniref:Uncharacterized protein n=1 Tax=Glarea lozoyensis (strain ATCC 20868 / MF5171) TaxID=1116229 RepID=S3CQG1_GLAL2|nr:uncharacterized protein GLAREA_09818 [Glarea lozoyensis ATCC 20868]EPE28697.1 hypothetical protein GLAREA_09818 [Glarea lozoyensis ATCC 20868]
MHENFQKPILSQANAPRVIRPPSTIAVSRMRTTTFDEADSKQYIRNILAAYSPSKLEAGARPSTPLLKAIFDAEFHYQIHMDTRLRPVIEATRVAKLFYETVTKKLPEIEQAEIDWLLGGFLLRQMVLKEGTDHYKGRITRQLFITRLRAEFRERCRKAGY